jgi:hypothetical protein
VSPLRAERADKPTYRILDRLSDGRADDVFLAHHETFNGKCVQKTVRIHGLEDALASNEPAFLNQLDHAHIVPVREAQWDPEGHSAITFVMPQLAGGSVNDALKQDYRFSIAQAIAIVVDALDALAYLRREFNAATRPARDRSTPSSRPSSEQPYWSEFPARRVSDVCTSLARTALTGPSARSWLRAAASCEAVPRGGGGL